MNPAFFIDSHAHIYGQEFTPDFEAMLARARDAGVQEIVVVGADLESSLAAVELVASRPGLYAAVGIHPHDAGAVSEETYDDIRRLAQNNPKVLAIGEIGLDFYRDRAPRPLQEEVFRRQIRIARALELPVIIHDRDAHDRVMAILREEEAWEAGGVLHCFSGDLQMARECIDMGFYVSIPGTITYANNEQLREVVRGIRIENLLIETDCPYLSPIPYRGKRNEPAYVRVTAEKVAELKGLSLEDVGRITTLNTRRLFRIGQPDQQAKIAYTIRNSLYLNITNRCSNRCTFCPKFDDFIVKGHLLKLDHEPTSSEVLAAIGDPGRYDEVVFCGYGESLIRLDLVKRVAAEMKHKGAKVRVNTDGQANLVHGRNILPELKGLVDCVSVSLNAPDAATYAGLCNTPYGDAGFQAVCDFLRDAQHYIPEVIATAVTVPGVDIDAVERLANSLGVAFRKREYAEVG